jgi:hypothetical protein
VVVLHGGARPPTPPPPRRPTTRGKDGLAGPPRAERIAAVASVTGGWLLAGYLSAEAAYL